MKTQRCREVATPVERIDTVKGQRNRDCGHMCEEWQQLEELVTLRDCVKREKNDTGGENGKGRRRNRKMKVDDFFLFLKEE